LVILLILGLFSDFTCLFLQNNLASLASGIQFSAEEHNNTVEIRKLEISFALRCQWRRGNLPVRSVWSTGTKDYCIENVEFEISKI